MLPPTPRISAVPIPRRTDVPGAPPHPPFAHAVFGSLDRHRPVAGDGRPGGRALGLGRRRPPAGVHRALPAGSAVRAQVRRRRLRGHSGSGGFRQLPGGGAEPHRRRHLGAAGSASQVRHVRGHGSAQPGAPRGDAPGSRRQSRTPRAASMPGGSRPARSWAARPTCAGCPGRRWPTRRRRPPTSSSCPSSPARCTPTPPTSSPRMPAPTATASP